MQYVTDLSKYQTENRKKLTVEKMFLDQEEIRG